MYFGKEHSESVMATTFVRMLEEEMQNYNCKEIHPF